MTKRALEDKIEKMGGIAKVREMAAWSRVMPQGSRDSKGRILPLRYRVAESLLNALEGR